MVENIDVMINNNISVILSKISKDVFKYGVLETEGK